jgi:hypothetical protein
MLHAGRAYNEDQGRNAMSIRFACRIAAACAAAVFMLIATGTHAQTSRPNILVIMGDDVGTWNISAYDRGMMGGSTPNIERIANGLARQHP